MKQPETSEADHKVIASSLGLAQRLRVIANILEDKGKEQTSSIMLLENEVELLKRLCLRHMITLDEDPRIKDLLLHPPYKTFKDIPRHMIYDVEWLDELIKAVSIDRELSGESQFDEPAKIFAKIMSNHAYIDQASHIGMLLILMLHHANKRAGANTSIGDVLASLAMNFADSQLQREEA